MLSQISTTFAELRRRGEAALIPYITAGYPDIVTNERIVLELFRSGADIVELGIPFSDPLADGATIQRASATAIAQGVQVSTCFDTARRVRAQVDSPLILMGYFNTILSYGVDIFSEDCSAAGISGLIVPDLPPEEAGDLKTACAARNVDLVFLLAPASTDDRISLVAAASAGFVYCVSVAGVTGARAEVSSRLGEFVGRVRQKTSLPLAVGFGISTPEQVKSVARIADGIIVGSALIDLIDRHEEEDIFPAVREYIKSLKEACKADEM